jgi:hypothetical protein
VAGSTVLVAAAASAVAAALPAPADAQTGVATASLGLSAVTRTAPGAPAPAGHPDAVSENAISRDLGWRFAADAQLRQHLAAEQKTARRDEARAAARAAARAGRRAAQKAVQRRAAQQAASQHAAAQKTAAQQSASPAVATTTSGSPEQIAAAMLGSYGWSPGQMSCLIPLWNRESGWSTTAANSSGAHGIPQALPGAKMASAGADWQTDPATQIRWGLGYIQATYGSPCAAWAHEESAGWY